MCALSTAGFQFATAGSIIFGRGRLEDVPPWVAARAGQVLLATGSHPERASGLRDALDRAGLSTTVWKVAGEPTTDLLLEGVDVARQAGCDALVAMGGGSVIDAGKAVAAMLANEGSPYDYLEVVGMGKQLERPSVPCVAVPTTAGTGAEVTRNAVLRSPKHGVKVSMRSPFLLPDLALVDPQCTDTMPPALTASTGLDALTQLLEAFVSQMANPLTDGICREGLSRIGRALPRAYENGRDKDARDQMALASLFSGLALANAKLGAVHGFAGPIGGMFPAAHGLACASLLPHVCVANVEKMRASDPDSPALRRYAEAFRRLSGREQISIEQGLDWIKELCVALQTPSLQGLGIEEEDLQEVVEKAGNSSSMKGNPAELNEDEMLSILRTAL